MELGSAFDEREGFGAVAGCAHGPARLAELAELAAMRSFMAGCAFGVDAGKALDASLLAMAGLALQLGVRVFERIDAGMLLDVDTGWREAVWLMAIEALASQGCGPELSVVGVAVAGVASLGAPTGVGESEGHCVFGVAPVLVALLALKPVVGVQQGKAEVRVLPGIEPRGRAMEGVALGIMALGAVVVRSLGPREAVGALMAVLAAAGLQGQTLAEEGDQAGHILGGFGAVALAAVGLVRSAQSERPMVEARRLGKAMLLSMALGAVVAELTIVRVFVAAVTTLGLAEKAGFSLGQGAREGMGVAGIAAQGSVPSGQSELGVAMVEGCRISTREREAEVADDGKVFAVVFGVAGSTGLTRLQPTVQAAAGRDLGIDRGVALQAGTRHATGVLAVAEHAAAVRGQLVHARVASGQGAGRDALKVEPDKPADCGRRQQADQDRGPEGALAALLLHPAMLP